MQTIFLFFTLFLAGAFVCCNEARHIDPKKIFDELSVIEGQLKDFVSAEHPEHADEEKGEPMIKDFEEVFNEDEQLTMDQLRGSDGNTLDLTVLPNNNDQMFTEDAQLSDDEASEDELAGGDGNTLDLTVPFKYDDPEPNEDLSEEDLMNDVNDESELNKNQLTGGDTNSLDLTKLKKSAKIDEIQMKDIFSYGENMYNDQPTDEDMDQDQMEAFDDSINNPYSDSRENMMESYEDEGEQW